MNAEPLDASRSYLLKHTSQTVKVRATTVGHRVNMQTLEQEPSTTLELNSIGLVEIETTRPLFLDTYAALRTTGSFILIDAVSHATVAAGMVREIFSSETQSAAAVTTPDDSKTHAVAAIALKNTYLLRVLESHLLDAGIDVVRTRDSNPDLLRRLLQARVVVLIEGADDAEVVTEVSLAVPSLDGSSDLAFKAIENLPVEPEQALAAVLAVLVQNGIVTATVAESGT